MSESIDILIKADDQATSKIVAVGESTQQVEKILNSLKGSSERYEQQLEELTKAYKLGTISAENFAKAQTTLQEKIKGNGNAFKEVGGKAKATSEFVGVLASLTGNSEIASFAGQMGQVTEKVGQFSEVSKMGGAGALAFKLGLVSLVATIAVGIGKAIGDWAMGTAKATKEMAEATKVARELESALIAMQRTLSKEQMEDIELIRDPAAKEAAYAQLLETMNADIAGLENQVRQSKKTVEEWNDAWQITGERKQSAIMAADELENDKARLKQAQETRAELQKITGERAKENAAIREANALKDKSESYLETLRQEVEYLKATKEEQLKLDAARNTTVEDRGEAEQLLRERDAILAKAEAEKQAAEDKKKLAEDTAKAVADAWKYAEDVMAKIASDAAKVDAANKDREQKKVDAANAEIKRLDDIRTSEMQSLELRRIEMEQGKEAAKVQSLINQGLDEKTAKEIAAKEAGLDKAEKLKADMEKEKDKPEAKSIASLEGVSLQAQQSRLLTRGPGDARANLMDRIARATEEAKAKAEKIGADQLQQLTILNTNLANKPQLVLQEAV